MSTELSEVERTNLYILQAKTYAKQHDLINTIATYSKIDNTDHTAQMIVDTLAKNTLSTIKQQIKHTNDKNILAWLRFAQILKTHKSPHKLLEWQHNNPDHLANTLIQAYQFNNKVALLPLHGQFEEASNTIINGFVTKMFHNNNAHKYVEIFDTSNRTSMKC